MNYLLIDANNLAARCHHAQNDLSTANGTKTGAIYGSLRGISWVRNTLKIPLYAVVLIWDGGHSSVRKLAYPEYKKGRKLNTPNTPEQEADSKAYRWQLEKLREILAHTEVKQVQVPGVEADDLISVFAALLKQDGHAITVFSGDNDMHQLADIVTIFDPKKEVMSDGDILKKWKLNDLADIALKKAMWGDSSDNIKGVPGVGDKRASIACCFLKAEAGRVVKKNEDADGGDARLVEKILTGVFCEHSDKGLCKECKKEKEPKTTSFKSIVERNLVLMDLPRTWDDSLLTWGQCEEALVQFLNVSQGDFQQFIAELKTLEMHSILETLGRW